MRVLFALSLLCMSMLCVSGQYVTSSTSTTSAWIFSAPASATGNNPTLTLTAGQTYTFSIGASQQIHPFAFSATGPTNTPATTPIDTTVYTVTPSAGCIGTGASGAGYQGGNCTVSLTIAANAPNATIYYKCTNHALMTGTITVVAAAAGPTPTIPSGTPAPTTGGTITGNSFRITGTNGTSNWIFTANGVQYSNPTLIVTAGKDVTFSIETNTRVANPFPHPFAFSNSSSNPIQPTQAYFPDIYNTWTVNNGMYCDQTLTAARSVTANATNPATNPCVITIKGTDVQVSTIYYRCAFHQNMIGAINIVAAGSSSSSSTGGNPGSSTGGNPGSSTGSSTGKNSASTVAGAGMALMVAFIATLFA